MKLKNIFTWQPDNTKATYTPIMAWLEYASAESIFSWLKSNAGPVVWFDGESFDEEEEFLLSKNNELINLGLAIYGNDLTVLKHLYTYGDDRIRHFVLQGTATSSTWHGGFFDKEINRIIEKKDLELIKIIFQNKHTPDEFITQFLEKNKPFDKLLREEWFILLIWLSKSKRFLAYQPRYEFEPYDHHRLFHAAWKLFDQIDPRVLSGLDQSRAISSLWGLALNIRCAMLTKPNGYSLIGPNYDIEPTLGKWKSFYKDNQEIDDLADIIEVLEWLTQNKDPKIFSESYALQNQII